MTDTIFGVAWAVNTALYAADLVMCRILKQPSATLVKFTIASGALSAYHLRRAARARASRPPEL